MIMQNIPQKEPAKYKRLFTKILHEAQKHWCEIEYDPATKTARGTLATDGRLIIILLSFDGIENRLALTVRLPVKKELDMPSMRQILRYQNHHHNLSSFLTIDDECSMASICANARVYEDKLSPCVACIFKDTYALLKDKGLNELLN